VPPLERIEREAGPGHQMAEQAAIGARLLVRKGHDRASRELLLHEVEAGHGAGVVEQRTHPELFTGVLPPQGKVDGAAGVVRRGRGRITRGGGPVFSDLPPQRLAGHVGQASTYLAGQPLVMEVGLHRGRPPAIEEEDLQANGREAGVHPRQQPADALANQDLGNRPWSRVIVGRIA